MHWQPQPWLPTNWWIAITTSIHQWPWPWPLLDMWPPPAPALDGHQVQHSMDGQHQCVLMAPQPPLDGFPPPAYSHHHLALPAWQRWQQWAMHGKCHHDSTTTTMAGHPCQDAKDNAMTPITTITCQQPPPLFNGHHHHLKTMAMRHAFTTWAPWIYILGSLYYIGANTMYTCSPGVYTHGWVYPRVCLLWVWTFPKTFMTGIPV